MDEIDTVNENFHTLEQCSHQFHTDCIVRNIQTGNICCPQCRKLPPFVVDVEESQDMRRGLIGEYNLEQKNKYFKKAIQNVKNEAASKKLEKKVEQYTRAREKYHDIRKHNKSIRKKIIDRHKLVNKVINEESKVISNIKKEFNRKIREAKKEFNQQNNVGKYKACDISRLCALYNEIASLAGYIPANY
jgi:uncharacterized Zn finger protein (UPF0148 family)